MQLNKGEFQMLFKCFLCEDTEVILCNGEIHKEHFDIFDKDIENLPRQCFSCKNWICSDCYTDEVVEFKEDYVYENTEYYRNSEYFCHDCCTDTVCDSCLDPDENKRCEEIHKVYLPDLDSYLNLNVKLRVYRDGDKLLRNRKYCDICSHISGECDCKSKCPKCDGYCSCRRDEKYCPKEEKHCCKLFNCVYEGSYHFHAYCDNRNFDISSNEDLHRNLGVIKYEFPRYEENCLAYKREGINNWIYDSKHCEHCNGSCECIPYISRRTYYRRPIVSYRCNRCKEQYTEKCKCIDGDIVHTVETSHCCILQKCKYE